LLPAAVEVDPQTVVAAEVAANYPLLKKLKKM
jgi:hypothetical protein